MLMLTVCRVSTLAHILLSFLFLSEPLRKARAPTMVEALDDEEQTLTIEEINDYIRSDTVTLVVFFCLFFSVELSWRTRKSSSKAI